MSVTFSYLTCNALKTTSKITCAIKVYKWKRLRNLPSTTITVTRKKKMTANLSAWVLAIKRISPLHLCFLDKTKTAPEAILSPANTILMLLKRAKSIILITLSHHDNNKAPENQSQSKSLPFNNQKITNTSSTPSFWRILCLKAFLKD